MAGKKNYKDQYFRSQLFVGFGPDGKKKYKSFYGSGKKEAEAKRAEYIDGLNQGLNYDLEKQTVQDALRTWLDIVIMPTGIKETTMMRYNHVYELTKPIWTVRVSEIRPLQVQAMFNSLKSYPTAKQVYKLLNRFFKYCVDSGYLTRNPMISVAIPDRVKEGYNKQEIVPFNLDEKQKILEYAREDNQLYYTILSLLFKYGARVGEILALSNNDIDFENRTITINSTLSVVKTDHGYENIKTRPKTKSSSRTLYFDAQVELLIKSALFLKGNSIVKNDLIFVQRSGEPIFSSNLLKYFYKVQDQLEIPRRTIHSIRHTFITECYYKGIDEMTLQAIIGHAKGSEITKKIYTHLRQDDIKVKMLEAIK